MNVQSGNDPNLDSLLDTMANAVGIFVVVLAIVQITVGEAVRRIEEQETERSASESEEAASRLASLEEQWEATRPRAWEAQQELERLKSRLEVNVPMPMSSPSQRAQLAARHARLARNLLEAKGLEAKVAEKQQRLARLQIQVEDENAEAAKAEASVRLPDPRLAPYSAEETIFVVRYGRVSFLAHDELLDAYLHAKRSITQKPRGGSIPDSELAAYLKRHRVGDGDFRWSLTKNGRRITSPILTWRDERVGESWHELRREDSEFRKALRATSPNRRYTQFYVWDDSFRTYVEARRIAELAGFAAGWVPMTEEDDLEVVNTRFRAPRALPVD